MRIFNHYVKTHKDLFRFQKAQEVHPHDKFLYRVFMKKWPKTWTPNKITAFRVLITPIVFYFIMMQMYEIGMVAFLFAAFTDALDGSLARSRNQITKFGMMFDPLADKLLIGSIVLLLVFKYFNPILGFSLLGIEIIFILSALFARVKFKTVKMANIWGKIKMVLQVVAVFATLSAILLDAPNLFTIAAWTFGIAIGFAIVSLFAHGV
ncbi:MAG: CDP-alcohol phosphatidyltransferase family protein [Candidatus Magasanikbacteria bacterium]|nr:CDP-alcohol phosphatidyltransferase family protein [Candidatus Magasanikbacteria bacterium]